ncbi:putative minus-end-directed kinesin ATPase [Helianthus annuus]|nr:putative minus-end-directed kinesin ATPase [Helianthus annuus]
MMKMKNTKKSFRSLTETIHSLLGFKTETNSTWANTVCDIIKSLPSTADYENDYDDSAHARDRDHDHDHDDVIISKIHGELATLNREVGRLNAQRRRVLNEFLQLKGNIRVFCRIRPTINGEKFSHQRPVVPVDSSGILVHFAENKRKLYNFDMVLHPGSTQDEVFSEIEPVIKSALDGYNVCILAYGQTGTGKTFTMEGNPDSPGVVPRTIEALFKQAADSNHTYLFSFSMLEIYLGQLKDLLIPHARKATDPLPPCLSIQTDPNGGIVIDNLVSIQVSNFNHAISLYRLGSQLRSTASTNSNKVSSRSHCMIRMSMTCSDATERRKVTNKIWMVDLGGSERVLKTKAWGRRFEEGKAINLSLSALGDVINALQRKNSHIPYRNSKLTQVLKDSLGEDSKTLMLVHVSPKEEDLCETVCSLNFALRLRSIHLGKTESNETRVMREKAMTDLQHEMQEIENNRYGFIKEIKKLNQKLDSLTKTSTYSNEKLDGLLSSTSSLKAPQDSADEITVTPQSSKIPRFMKPTICSTRKSGTGNQNLYKRDIRPARRKKLPLSRAESVSFPLKNMTESYSGSSISRASYLVGLNERHSEINDIDLSSVNESEANYRVSLHENKRVISNPARLKKSKHKEHIKHMKQGKPADVKFAGEESRYENSSTTPSTAGTKSVTGVDDSSTECDMYCRVMPCDTVDDTCHQNDDDSEVVEWAVISQLSTREARNLEACCELEDDLRAELSSFDKVILQDLTNHSFKNHEHAETRGFSDILKDNIVMMCNSVLLALGFKSLGFDNDFFQALMI